MENHWRYVARELTARGAKVFGSLERMEARLRRFQDAEDHQAAVALVYLKHGDEKRIRSGKRY
jgi:hypothetical protein